MYYFDCSIIMLKTLSIDHRCFINVLCLFGCCFIHLSLPKKYYTFILHAHFFFSHTMVTFAIIVFRLPLLFSSQCVAKILTFICNLYILFCSGLVNILYIQLNIELLLYLTKAWRKSSFLNGKLGWLNVHSWNLYLEG